MPDGLVRAFQKLLICSSKSYHHIRNLKLIQSTISLPKEFKSETNPCSYTCASPNFHAVETSSGHPSCFCYSAPGTWSPFQRYLEEPFTILIVHITQIEWKEVEMKMKEVNLLAHLQCAFFSYFQKTIFEDSSPQKNYSIT